MPRPTINPGKRELLQKLECLGSVNSVASYYGVHRAAVSRWLRRSGVKDQRSRKRQLTDEQAREVLKRGPVALPTGISWSVANDIQNARTYRDI